LVHRAFEIGIGLKAINAILECLAGAPLFAIPASWIATLVVLMTQHELSGDPKDVVANFPLGWAHGFSPASSWYAVYLFIHGVVKLGLVVALFKEWMWAHPASLVIFGAFAAYQIYQYTLDPSWGLAILTGIDLVVMWLIWREHVSVRNAVSSQRPRGSARKRRDSAWRPQRLMQVRS
jgi:uncharacterized membrane protein